MRLSSLVRKFGMRRWACAIFILACAMQIGMASPVTVSASGTYSGQTPNSFFTAPGAAWSLSFVTDSNPSVSEAAFGIYFSPSFIDFTYSLNGSPITMTPEDITFWVNSSNAPYILTLSICWSSSCVGGTTEGIAFDTVQLYTGSTLAPTIGPGVYPTSEFFIDDGSSYGEPNTTVRISSTPEPLTLPFAAFALVTCIWLSRPSRGALVPRNDS